MNRNFYILKIMMTLSTILHLSLNIEAQSDGKAGETKTTIKYIYKQKEFVDLGDLEIKGSLIAPGDLSVSERERKMMSRPLTDRRDFDDISTEDIRNLK